MTTTKPLITAEYLLRAHDLGRCELVRGELITMSPAGAEHGSIISNIQLCLALYVSREGVGRVFGAETGFQIAHEPDSVRAPDVAFVTRDRLPSQPPQGFFPGPPDLAVEVVSPSDRDSEVSAKIQSWLDAGCRVVWMVDPRRKTVHVYQGDSETQVFGLSGTLVGGPLLPGFSLAVADIFKWNP
jgi:Uma2 family endonuclease